MKMPVLLIVDDEKPTRDALRMGFQDDYEVYTAANLSQASALLQEESPDLVLTDLRLGGESGMDVLKAAASLPHPPQSIMMTAYGSVDAAVAAMKEGAYDFVTKPLNLAAVELVMALEEAVGISIAEEDAANLKTVGDIMTYLAAHKN